LADTRRQKEHSIDVGNARSDASEEQ